MGASLSVHVEQSRSACQRHPQHQGLGHDVLCRRGGDVKIDVSPMLLRRQMTLIASWTVSLSSQRHWSGYPNAANTSSIALS
jgi:hypothetical protein